MTAKRSNQRSLADAREGLTTGEKLVQAALLEFNEHGFGGTDSNKIARRAGFAPQSFYRWFANKTVIFLAAYRAWEVEEAVAIGSLRGKGPVARRMAVAIVAHHRAYLGFRRSLRLLAYEVDVVRQARADSRRRQIAKLRAWIGPKGPSDEEMLMILLQMERLSDAIAEGELSDLRIDDSNGVIELASLIRRLGVR